MKSIEELKALFESELKQNLQGLEAKRKKLKGIYLLYGSILILSLLFVFALADRFAVLLYIGIAGIIFCGVKLFQSMKLKREYRKEFKLQVVSEIVKLVNPDWNYHYDRCISQGDYFKSELYTTGIDRYRGDDLIRGQIEQTDFEFSELHTEYKRVTTDSKGNRKEEWVTVFRGLFAHADFNKEIMGKTFVLPDTAEKLFGRLGRKLQKMNPKGKLISMENPAFEKKFVVYGSDQIESRYVVTPSMMEAMLHMVEKYRKPISFSFIGSRVYCAIPFSKNLFEPRIFKSGVNFADIEEMHSLFGIMQTLIHEMNLNTRIWTKA